MKKFYTYIIYFSLIFIKLKATHNRAGEITFKHIEGYTYEFTITTYTYTPSFANRDYLTIEWGDNTSSIAYMAPGYPIRLPDNYRHNVYKAIHTFPGPGIYQILMQDPNRNLGVKNIPNSVNVVFAIKTIFIINGNIGDNNSPILLNPPKDKAALGHRFIHNPAAYDPDGDSLSYELSICLEQDGKPIKNYSLPSYSDTLYVDSKTGDLIWESPTDTGKYNIAMTIYEWRNGIRISSIQRDMQIEVFKTDNNPPENPESQYYCIESGKTITLRLTTTDKDGDKIIQQLYGGPLILNNNPASYVIESNGYGYSTLKFEWNTNCSHIRKLPYQITLKSQDINNDISLVDIDNYYIKVIAPPIKKIKAIPSSTNIKLEWEKSECENAIGYYVYRKIDSTELVIDTCATGLSVNTGFKRIATVYGLNNTSFVDEGKDESLLQGLTYCYIVTAFFKDGAESYHSEQVCTSLIPGIPSLINASVENISEKNGNVLIKWIKPKNIDTTKAKGPYLIKIYRSDNLKFPDKIIDSIFTNNLNDTIYIDKNLNTLKYPYNYAVKITNIDPGNEFVLGDSNIESASTMFLDLTPNDNRITIKVNKKVPWVNYSYIIYRYNEVSGNFDSISISDSDVFIDKNLQNGKEYCYRVKSYGWRPADNSKYFNTNYSHVSCAIPKDITPPCPPQLTVTSFCDSSFILVKWTNPNNFCCDDVIQYELYYSPTFEGEMKKLITKHNASDTAYKHFFTGDMQIAGCYYIIAIDSAENKSQPSQKICVDECYLFDLPNFFSPNNDNINDFFHAYNRNNAVKKIDLKIYNRWGDLVYKTDNPNFKWDGTNFSNGKLVTPGVYYYVCDVYEPRINGIVVRNMVGFIHIFTDKASEFKPLPEK